MRVRRPNLPLRGIRVVEYLTELPPPELLEQKLKGGGGDCARAAAGDDRGRVCGRVCGEASYMGCRNCDYGDLSELGEKGE